MANGIRTQSGRASAVVRGENRKASDAASAVHRSSSPRLNLNTKARPRRLHERLAPWGAVLLVILIVLWVAELVTKFGRNQLKPPKPRPPVVEELASEKLVTAAPTRIVWAPKG